MKKLISILLLVIFVSPNISFACQTNTDCNIATERCDIKPPLQEWTCVSNIPGVESSTKCDPSCQENETCTLESPTGKRSCEKKQTSSFMWISCNEDQLVNGQCKFNINETLGIKKWETNSVGILVQDIVLSATFFIGTVVTIALIVSWLMYIFAASSGKDPANAKKWIMWSLIGLLIVVSSYIIIRLVQYIAKGF